MTSSLPSWWEDFEQVNEASQHSGHLQVESAYQQQQPVMKNVPVAFSSTVAFPSTVFLPQQSPLCVQNTLPSSSQPSVYGTLLQSAYEVTSTWSATTVASLNAVRNRSVPASRRPSAPSIQTCNGTSGLPPNLAVSTEASSLITKVSSMWNGTCPTKPPGLQNKCQNLCFMNVILQTLSRSPLMLHSMSDVFEHNGCISALSSPNNKLFTELLKLLSCMRQFPVTNDSKPHYNKSPLNTVQFRKAASSVSSKPIIYSPNEKQPQQDAGEFLMWLLEEIHTALNSLNHQIYRPLTSKTFQ